MLLLSECCMCTDAHTVGWISLICMMASFEVWWCSKMAYCYWSTDSFSCVNLINWVNDSFLGMFSCLLQFIATYCFPLSQMFGDQQHLYFTPACENSKEKIKASPPNTLWTHKRQLSLCFAQTSPCVPHHQGSRQMCAAAGRWSREDHHVQCFHGPSIITAVAIHSEQRTQQHSHLPVLKCTQENNLQFLH